MRFFNYLLSFVGFLIFLPIAMLVGAIVMVINLFAVMMGLEE